MASAAATAKAKAMSRLLKDQMEAAAAGMPPSAFKDFFMTLELAEMIFLQFDMKEILTKLIQVCRLWHWIFTNYKPMQEILFIKPIIDEPVLLCNDMAGRLYWAGRGSQHIPRRIIQHPFIYLLSRKQTELSDAVSDPEASWRRMLLTQPPVTEIKACTKSDWSDLKEITRLGEPIKMGDVADDLGTIHGIRGWGKFSTSEDKADMFALKKAMNFRRDW